MARLVTPSRPLSRADVSALLSAILSDPPPAVSRELVLEAMQATAAGLNKISHRDNPRAGIFALA